MKDGNACEELLLNESSIWFVKRINLWKGVKEPNCEEDLPKQESVELKMCWKGPFYAMSDFD
jgi:hypothetical protein